MYMCVLFMFCYYALYVYMYVVCIHSLLEVQSQTYDVQEVQRSPRSDVPREPVEDTFLHAQQLGHRTATATCVYDLQGRRNVLYTNVMLMLKTSIKTDQLLNEITNTDK